jgi:hypothetical protein
MSLIFGGLALFCHVVACACGWGTIGGLAQAAQSGLAQAAQSSSFSLIVALPGAGLAGWSLFLLLLSVILEVSSRSCCKDWKPPSAAMNPSGSTTIVVTSPIASVAMVPPPLPVANGWLRQTDGKDTWFVRGRQPLFSPLFFYQYPAHARTSPTPPRCPTTTAKKQVFQPADQGDSVAAAAGRVDDRLRKNRPALQKV